MIVNAALAEGLMEKGAMMQFGGAFLLLTLLSGAALADDARRLRIEAGALVQQSETVETARERRSLLERAHGKLLEIRERFPDQPVRLNLYLAGKRVGLSPEDVAAMIAAAPLVDLEVGKLREAIGRQLSPTAADENGWTDLHWAAALNLPALARALLDNGADISAPLKDDEEPLSDRLKRSLSSLGLDPTYINLGDTPLHIAASANAREVVEALIAAGANVHAKGNDGLTPLHAAAFRNAREVTVALIAAGAHVHVKDNLGHTPLHVAAFGNAREVAAALIAAGANVHAKDNGGRTPLHRAAWKNAREVAATLVAAGADVDAKDDAGRTPLAVALERNSRAVSTYLREMRK